MDYSVIFDRLDVTTQSDQAKLSYFDQFNEYAQIAELSRLAEAIREPEPLSFTIG